MQSKYDVVVRAIVSCDEDKLKDHLFGEKWDVYDYTSQDGMSTVRLDTVVEVKAGNKEDAIEQAKDMAPSLQLSAELSIDTVVTIWVDDEQDDDVKIVA